MEWLTWLPMLIQAAGAIKAVIDVANDNDGIVKNIQQSIPLVAPILENIGKQMFPKVEPQLAAAAAAMYAFDPDVTKWLQGSLNRLLTPSPNLEVDGIYGPLTAKAVEQAQTELGLTVDGWAGTFTRAAIDFALNKDKSE